MPFKRDAKPFVKESRHQIPKGISFHTNHKSKENTSNNTSLRFILIQRTKKFVQSQPKDGDLFEIIIVISS